MKNNLKTVYRTVLLVLCLAGLVNCSDGDDADDNGGKNNGITAIANETEKMLPYTEKPLNCHLQLLPDGLHH